MSNPSPDCFEVETLRQKSGAVLWLVVCLLIIGVIVPACALHNLILNKQTESNPVSASQTVAAER